MITLIFKFVVFVSVYNQNRSFTLCLSVVEVIKTLFHRSKTFLCSFTLRLGNVN